MLWVRKFCTLNNNIMLVEFSLFIIHILIVLYLFDEYCFDAFFGVAENNGLLMMLKVVVWIRTMHFQYYVTLPKKNIFTS